MKFSIHSQSLAKRFTNVFSNLSTLTDSVVLYFKEDGLYMQGMDTSHVSLYEANFDKSWFTTYKPESTDVRQIAVNLTYFKKILSTRGDDQSIYIEYNGSSPDSLTIIFRSVVKETQEFPREYKLTLMDIDADVLDIPNEERSVQFYIDSKTFSVLIKQLSMFDDSVVIKCSDEEIRFSSTGNEGSMSVNLFDKDKDYIDEFSIDEDYKLKITFALLYFENFCAFQKVSSKVRLSFSNDFPVEMFYSLESSKKTDNEENNDEESPKSFLRFFLAPKIKDDEESDDDE
jgi:proliferating cell nuclear antigen